MEYENGPDQIIPCENIITSDIAGCVKLQLNDPAVIQEKAPESIPGLLHRIASLYPDTVALIERDDKDKIIKYTFREYEEAVRTCAKAFIKLGLQRFQSVGIIGFNSPEWFFSDLGAIYAGGIAAGVYTTNTSEACRYCAEKGNIAIFVAEDDKQIQKIVDIKDRLPQLKAIIQYKGTPVQPGIISWQQLMNLGREQSDDILNERLKKIAVNQCSTLVYTSGTVGQPKAVMLSHDNLISNVNIVKEVLKMEPCAEVIVSYLPLSHVAAQVVDLYLTICCGSTTFFADRNALKGSLVNTLKVALPTKFLGVPRVWEKIQEQMLAVGAQNNIIKKFIGSWAKVQGLKQNFDKMKGEKNTSWSYYLANAIVFKKIKQSLGLSRCNFFVSAAAPLSNNVKRYFLSLDMPIMEAFGMSEVAGAHTVSTEDSFDLFTVGCTLQGFSTKINEPNEDGDGEICMKGRHVFMGYVGDDEKNKDAVDADGWLHSGDIGHVNKKGQLYITGRIKELIITAGGENVAPVPIEERIKFELPQISNAMIVGDRQKFLAVFLSFKTEMDPETGAPTETFSKSVLLWLEEFGCNAKTITEFLSEPSKEVMSAIQDALDRVNAQAISNAQRIQKFSILPSDFSIATGELGPTMKMKRNVVLSKYDDVVKTLYNEAY